MRVERLTKVGFEVVGRWIKGSDDLHLTLERWQDISPALYAFVVHGKVMYVGKTAQTLRQRLAGYRRPGPTQTTNIRVRAKMVEVLGSVPEIQIMAFRDSGLQTYGAFKIDMPAALEDDIIRQLNPPWNGRGSAQQVAFPHAKTVKPPSAGPDVGAPARRQEANAVHETQQFRVKAGRTYRNQGFFNVPVAHAHLFGPHGDDLSVLCHENSQAIPARVNRTANANGSPRIFGKAPLRAWLQASVGLGEDFLVEVIDSTTIRLAPA